MTENDEMLLITGEGVESLEKRLLDPQQVGECRKELQRMLEIKEALYWRADMGSCCAGSAMPAKLFAEVRLLEAALQAFDEGNTRKAAASLREFSLLTEINGTL